MSHKYRKEDFKQVTWEEYGKTLNKLCRKVDKYVKSNKIKIDAIVPILRGGAFPGAYLSFKLGLLRTLPVQYKYFFKGKNLELRKILGFSKKDAKLSKTPTFLLVEGNHCFGLTAETAAKDLKEQFPNSKIIYAADHMDYSYQKNKYADILFYGKLTNECRELSVEKCKAEGVKNPFSNLFPWESIDEEYITVKGEQFDYKDLKDVLEDSDCKKVIDISEIFEEEK